MSASAQNSGIFAKGNTATKIVDYTPYMQGAVPMVNGAITFSKTIEAPGKKMSDLYLALSSWASARYMAGIENGKWTDKDYFRNLDFAKIKSADKEKGLIVCQGNEELVFSNKLLEKDFTQVEYILTLNITDGKVTATMNNIFYVYTFTSEKERFSAESYITDDASFTKKGKWIKANRKFRVKTINLANELFDEITTVTR